MEMKRFLLFYVLIIYLGNACPVHSQELMIGEQNGITWRALVIGTAELTLSRKTFYVDGLDNMSAFWSRHVDLQADSVDFNKAFIGMNVGQIRDGLDSFYVDEKNLHIPIVDAVLVIRLQNAQIDKGKIEDITGQFREATINGPEKAREKAIWREALKLIK
jgi:hypothetical protein